MHGALSIDPLFVGLTRPSMIFGVSLKFAAMNSIIMMILYIQGLGIKIIFIAGILHLIGYILSFKDPRFLEVYLNKVSKCGDTSNKGFYGGNSYSV